MCQELVPFFEVPIKRTHFSERRQPSFVCGGYQLLRAQTPKDGVQAAEFLFFLDSGLFFWPLVGDGGTFLCTRRSATPPQTSSREMFRTQYGQPVNWDFTRLLAKMGGCRSERVREESIW